MDMVLRLNLPPVEGFQKHVGSITTHDLVNDAYANTVVQLQHSLVGWDSEKSIYSLRNNKVLDLLPGNQPMALEKYSNTKFLFPLLTSCVHSCKDERLFDDACPH